MFEKIKNLFKRKRATILTEELQESHRRINTIGPGENIMYSGSLTNIINAPTNNSNTMPQTRDLEELERYVANNRVSYENYLRAIDVPDTYLPLPLPLPITEYPPIEQDIIISFSGISFTAFSVMNPDNITHSTINGQEQKKSENKIEETKGPIKSRLQRIE